MNGAQTVVDGVVERLWGWRVGANERFTFTAADLSRVETALACLLTPLDYPSLDAWRADVSRTVGALVGADAVLFALSAPTTDWHGGSVAEDASAVAERRLYTDDLSLDQQARWLALDTDEDHSNEVSAKRQQVVVTQDELVAAAGGFHAYLADRATQEFYLPNRLLDTISLAHWGDRAVTSARLMMHRDRRGTVRFGPEGKALLRLLSAAFHAGTTMISVVGARRRALAGVLDQLGVLAMIADEQGRIVHETPAWRAEAVNPAWRTLERTACALARTCAGIARVAASRPRSRTTYDLLDAARATSLTTRIADRHYRITATLAPAVLSPDGGPAGVIVHAAPLSPAYVSDVELVERFSLTVREIQVARHVTLGRTTKEIAAELNLSPHTVARHLERVFVKLGVHTRAAIGHVLGHPSR